MTGCDYQLHAGETLAADKVDGSLDINCVQSGEAIDLVVPFNGCAVSIPAQSGLQTLVFTNNTGGELKDFDIDIGLAGVEYKQNANCLGGEMTAANGEYSGKSTMRADILEVEQGTWVD